MVGGAGGHLLGPQVVDGHREAALISLDRRDLVLDGGEIGLIAFMAAMRSAGEESPIVEDQLSNTRMIWLGN